MDNALIPFADRRDAGRQLAALLEPFRAEAPLVLGLVRGGVPVAAEVAAALNAPLEALVVRKIGVPENPEFAMGAVAGGTVWLNESLIAELGIPRDAVNRVVAAETREAARREAFYHADHPPHSVEGRTLLVIDDGLATGATAHAAIQLLRRRGARRIVFGAPVCSESGAEMVGRAADAVVCVRRPLGFQAVGQAYVSFAQVTDGEVREALRSSSTVVSGEERG
jgi:predicted phosphoribosyltransferase